MSLIARHLETLGIPTVVIGSARDIVEECGVSRFVFTDLPLGNPMGPPEDGETHRRTLDIALTLIESAPAPATTVQAPIRWTDDEWRRTYMLVDDSNRDELRAAGAARMADQAARRVEKQQRAG